MEEASSDFRQGKLVVVGAFVALVAASIMAFWLLKKANKTPLLPPGPRGLPILGYLPFLGAHPHKSFTELARVYGPVYKLWFGHRIYVVVSSPSLAKQVRDHDAIFADRNPSIASRILTYGGNDIAFSPYGATWKKLRKVFVRELLSNARLEASYVLRRQKVESAKGICTRREARLWTLGRLHL